MRWSAARDRTVPAIASGAGDPFPQMVATTAGSWGLGGESTDPGGMGER